MNRSPCPSWSNGTIPDGPETAEPQREEHRDFDFSLDGVRSVLGIDGELLDTRYELNSGVVAWNNKVMAERGLFEKAADVFARCRGCIRRDQELLAFTAAVHDLPFTELDDSYNFCFFEESLRIDHSLRASLRQGASERIRIVHFVYRKPWRPLTSPRAFKLKAYFINAWRRFIVSGLGGDAFASFAELSQIRVLCPIGPFWNRFRRARAMFERVTPLPRSTWIEWLTAPRSARMPRRLSGPFLLLT